MLKCRDIARQGSDYLDGNQSFRQRMAMAMHLFACGNCRAFMRHLRTALAYYRQLPPVPLDDAEAAAIVTQVISKHEDNPL